MQNIVLPFHTAKLSIIMENKTNIILVHKIKFSAKYVKMPCNLITGQGNIRQGIKLAKTNK